MEERPLRPRATSTFPWSTGSPAAKPGTKISPSMATLVYTLITVTIAGVAWVDGRAIGTGVCGAVVAKQFGIAAAQALRMRVTARSEIFIRHISTGKTLLS